MKYRYYVVFHGIEIQTVKLDYLYKKVLRICDSENMAGRSDNSKYEDLHIWDAQIASWIHLSIPIYNG